MAVVNAHHRFVRISALKVRPFATLIRGRTAKEGLEVLRYLPNRGARLLEKVLKSCMANAEDRGVRNVDNLRIVNATIDGGPTMKRIRPRARGMAHVIRKRMAHIHITIEAPELP